VILYVEDVLEGKVDVEGLASRYVFLEPRTARFRMDPVMKAVIAALNYMAKFGWRVVSYSQGVCLLERVG
jgi:hypothetical protein